MVRASVVVLAVALVCMVVAPEVRGEYPTARVVKRRKHEFYLRDHVPLYVNNIGPYHNPTELYMYNKLPLCPIEHVERKHTTLGERLEGDRPILADIYNISFGGLFPLTLFVHNWVSLSLSPLNAHVKALSLTFFFFSSSSFNLLSRAQYL